MGETRDNRLGDVFIVEEGDVFIVEELDFTWNRVQKAAAYQQANLEVGDILIRDELSGAHSGFSMCRKGMLHYERWCGKDVGRFLFNVGDLPREMLGGLVGIGLVSSHDQGEVDPLAAGQYGWKRMGMDHRAGGEGESISFPLAQGAGREVPPENPVEKARGQSWDDPPGRHVAYKVAEVVAYLEDEQFSDLYPEELQALLERVLKDLKAVDR